jgi:hypothetical protein
MIALILKPFALSELDVKLASDRAFINDVQSVNVIDLDSISSKNACRVLSTAANITDVALINNLSVRSSITIIQNLFTRLYVDSSLTSRLNATYFTRDVFKVACLNLATSSKIDQKITIGFFVNRLQKLRMLDSLLIEALEQDFFSCLNFYAVIKRDILFILIQATSCISDADLEFLHKDMNNNLRLIDYFISSNSFESRCDEHRDYDIYIIIFQNDAVDEPEFETKSK